MSNEDTLRAIGKTIADDAEVGRDAVHIAVAPVVADRRLYPGEQYKGIGIVDPFLKEPVFPGMRFWLFLNPGSITSLRHEWSHPAFDEPKPRAATAALSEQWLRDFIARADCPGYDTVIAAAVGDHEKNGGDDDDNYFCSSNDGEYLHFGGRDAHGDIPAEFWDHVEAVTGRSIPSDMRAKFFSCSC